MLHRNILHIVIFAAILMATPSKADDETQAKVPAFSVQRTFYLPVYDYGEGEKKQDISGAAMGDGLIVLIDDGGRNSQYPEVRLTTAEQLDKPAPILRRQTLQKDMEAITYQNGAFYITASMSYVAEDTDDYLVLAELVIDPLLRKTKAERYTLLRDVLINGLRDHFQSPAWYGRIATTFAKEGGLNVEGLSTSHHGKNALAFGLRSPLWSNKFGSSKFGQGFSLDQGEAILVHVVEPFSNTPETRIETIKLGGSGIRSIEYIPQLLGGGYLISAGPVEKDSSLFSLWWYSPGHVATRINLPEFKQLCRPESILHNNRDRKILIMSEQSGNACNNTMFTAIELSY